MSEEGFIVDRFSFETEEEYELAMEEKRKIQYIEEHTDNPSVENMTVLYRRMVESNMFQTPLGYAYLDRVRGILLKSGISDEKLPKIGIKAKVSSETRKQIVKENKKLRSELEKKEKKYHTAIAVCCGLTVLVIALFTIAFTGKNPNILNYENVILNKYSEWEQELTERENAVREKELALKMNE